MNIEKIMSIDFINKNNINCIINCVGSTKKRVFSTQTFYSQVIYLKN